MRIIRDLAYVKRRKRIATVTSVVGVVLLASAFFLSLSGGGGDSTRILWAYVPLLAGTLMFHYGMQQIARWNRTPRNDMVLDTLLKSLGERYTMLHFVKTGKRVIDHVLIHPGGIEILTVRELAGKVTHEDGKWKRKGAGLGRLFGASGPQLGDPSMETEESVSALTSTLAANGLADVPVDGAIVFINRLAELDVHEPEFPVVNADGLPLFVRDLPVTPQVKPAERQAIVDLLAAGEEEEKAKPEATRRPVKRRAA